MMRMVRHYFYFIPLLQLFSISKILLLLFSLSQNIKSLHIITTNNDLTQYVISQEPTDAAPWDTRHCRTKSINNKNTRGATAWNEMTCSDLPWVTAWCLSNIWYNYIHKHPPSPYSYQSKHIPTPMNTHHLIN